MINNILANAIWCYQCVSTQPGCGTPFNWLFHWTKVCPEDDDVCVKILEEKDGKTLHFACLNVKTFLKTKFETLNAFPKPRYLIYITFFQLDKESMYRVVVSDFLWYIYFRIQICLFLKNITNIPI